MLSSRGTSRVESIHRQDRQAQVSQAMDLNAPPQQPEPAVGQLRIPEAQMPVAEGAPTNQDAELDPGAPRNSVAGGIIAPITRAEAPQKRKQGERGKDKPGTTRPKKKCKTCRTLGYPEVVQLNCRGKGGRKFCPRSRELEAMEALQNMHQG